MSKGTGLNDKVKRSLPKPPSKPAAQYPKVGAGMAPDWKGGHKGSGKGVNRSK